MGVLPSALFASPYARYDHQVKSRFIWGDNKMYRAPKARRLASASIDNSFSFILRESHAPNSSGRAIVFAVAIALTATGCANRQIRAANPHAITVNGMIIDAKGKDKNQIQTDANECATVAQETAPGERAVTGAVVGAVAGALIGALVFRSVGLSGNDGATYGAGWGGLSGGGNAAAAGAQDYRTVLRNCMIGRGHYPLN